MVRWSVCRQEGAASGRMGQVQLSPFVRSTGADKEQRADRGRFHQYTNLDANPRTATRFQGTRQHPALRQPRAIYKTLKSIHLEITDVK